MKNSCLFFGSFLLLSFLSCDNAAVQKQYAPIVLGDSTTIVTETDSNYLKNTVGDIETAPVNKLIDSSKNNEAKNDAPTMKDSVVTSTTVKEEPALVTTKAPKTTGVAIHVGNETYVLVEGIQGGGNRVQDGQKNSAFSFNTNNGKFASAQIKIHNGKWTKAQYRYTVLPQFSYNNKFIDLQGLEAQSSNWDALNSKGNAINIPTIKNINYKKVSSSQLKQSVTTTLQNRKYKKSAIDAAVKQISNRSTITSAPFSLDITAFEVRVQGVDAKGKSFDKTIKLTK